MDLSDGVVIIARNQIYRVLYVNLTRVSSCDTIGYRVLAIYK